jgi:hypothetical protein
MEKYLNQNRGLRNYRKGFWIQNVNTTRVYDKIPFFKKNLNLKKKLC